MADGPRSAETVMDLARLLRQLRRRDAHERQQRELTYREIAAKTGCSVGVIGDYLAGNILPPTDRFDALIRLLGATPAEQGALATARDRVAERRKNKAPDPVPHQLPADVPGFAGRARPLAELDDLLAQQDRTVMIAVVSGTAGVGKTALAAHWAHRVADQFPGGQLYVNMRGFDPGGPPMTPAQAVRGFLHALGVPDQRIPASLGEQSALYRSLLAGRRVLVVLDNVRDAAHVRPLLPGSAGGAVVVTSRDQLIGLVATGAAHPVTLDLLPTGEAQELLTRRLGAVRVAAEPGAVTEIIGRCARLPLALAIAAARAAVDRDLPLAQLARELDGTVGCLDLLGVGDPVADVRAVFSWSYRMLPEGAARLFRLLGLHPGPDLAVPAAASLAGLPEGHVRRLLDELARAHLIEHRAGRYGFHDLLRAYATDLAHAHDGADDRRAALHRTLDHYLSTAHTATGLVDPLRDPDTVGPLQPGVVTLPVADRPQALAWYAAEHPVLVAAIEVAACAGFEEYACRIAWLLGWILHVRGQWHDWAAIQQTALAAADRLSDRPRRADIHRDLAGAYTWLGRYDDAQHHFAQALDQYAALGDGIGLARTHRTICLLMERQGRYPQALDHARRSRDLYLCTDDRAGQAYAFNSVGWYHALVGDFPAALRDCQQAIDLLRETGDRLGEASTWDSLGYAHHHLGDHRRALDCYRRALDIFREFGDRYYEADTLRHIGDTHQAAGDRTAARTARQQALAVLDELAHPDAAQVRAQLRQNG